MELGQNRSKISVNSVEQEITPNDLLTVINKSQS